jgi:hypothetical protein
LLVPVASGVDAMAVLPASARSCGCAAFETPGQRGHMLSDVVFDGALARTLTLIAVVQVWPYEPGRIVRVPPAYIVSANSRVGLVGW